MVPLHNDALRILGAETFRAGEVGPYPEAGLYEPSWGAPFAESAGLPTPEILGEDSFRQALVRERKRSERSGKVMVLFVIEVRDGSAVEEGSIWAAAGEAVKAVRSEIDCVGWFEDGRALGLIVPEVSSVRMKTECDRLEAWLKRALANRLSWRDLDKVWIGLRAFPEPTNTEEGGIWFADRLLYPELRTRSRAWFSYEAIKRLVDLFGSLALLILLAPLFLVIATMVKVTSRGPVLFRQVRIGQMARPFTILKFRTMYTGVDSGIHQEYVRSFIASGQVSQSVGETNVFKLTNDPRITPVGRLLRKTSLDELPQLWNVLCGEMSLVGPRPPLPYELEQYRPWHRHRILEAKPGMTGLWQVTGRSQTTFDEMVRLDLRYARSRSLWTDIKILLATPAVVLLGKGAC